VCASDAFVYLTRWVPHAPPESRPVRPTAATTAAPGNSDTDGGGALTVIAGGLHQCFKRAQTRVELLALRKAGELR
jgi:hypothetical protein